MSSNRSLIKQYNQAFTFDWNDYRTIKKSEAQLPEIVSFLETLSNIDKTLQSDEKHELGQLCYKVGTFYNHIKRDADLAFAHLKIAEKYLLQDELAWTQNHLAFTCQQKLAAARKQDKLEEMELYSKLALQYCDETKNIITEIQNNPISTIAFTYCVQALTEYEMGNIQKDITHYKTALGLYESIKQFDDQYARAKNRLAMMLTERSFNIDAQKAFAELEQYWSKNKDDSNPYPARFFVTYGDFLAKAYPGNLALALAKYKKAYDILCITDGPDAGFTSDIGKKVLSIEEKLSALKKSNYSPTMYRANNPINNANTIVTHRDDKKPRLY